MNTILKLYEFNFKYAERLVQDVPESQMTFVPSPGLENHPAFTIGHLVMGSARVARTLGLDWDVPKGWKEVFDRNGPGDPRIPSINASLYPSKEALLTEFHRQHKRVNHAIENLESARLVEKADWRYDAILPTLKDVIGFMCVTHEAMHLSQLAAWRRAMQFPMVLKEVG